MAELTLPNLLLVGCGGFVGSVLRYAVALQLQRSSEPTAFPWGTLTVNLVGCLAIGLLAGLLEARQVGAPELRLALMVGLLGGFTTFSAFGLETLILARQLRWLAAGGYVLGSVALGLVAVWIGSALGRLG